MGLFRRSRREPDSGPDSGPEPGPADVVQRDARGDTTPAWWSAPPLTPTVSPPASTFKIGAAVKEDLVALDSPRLSHGMGHLTGGDGPAGVVGGLATVTVQRHEDGDDHPASSGTGVAPTAAVPDAGRSPEMPVVARTASGEHNGQGDADPSAGPADIGWGALLVPRIVPVAREAQPERSGRPVDALPVDTPARHLPLVLPPAVQRRDDTVPAGNGDGGGADVAISAPTGGDVDRGAEELPGGAVPPARPDDDEHDGDGIGAPGGDPTPTSIQRAVDGMPDSRPRRGALGPPLEAGPEAGPGTRGAPAPAAPTVPIGPVQRRRLDAAEPLATALDRPDTVGAGAGAGSAVMDLAIRQRPRPGGHRAGDHDATPTVARSAGPDLAGTTATPTSTDRGPGEAEPVLPLVQRDVDGDAGADAAMSATGVTPATTDLPGPANASAETPDGSVPAAAPRPGDTGGPTAETDAAARPAGPTDAAADRPGDDDAGVTVRPTLGLRDGVTGGGSAGEAGEAVEAVEGPTGAADAPDVPALPLPLPALQRRSAESPTGADRPTGSTTLRPGIAVPVPAAAAAGVAGPPGAGRPTSSLPPASPAATLPLAAQRSLAPAPSLGDALATRAPGGERARDQVDASPTVTPLLTWPEPAGGAARTGTTGRAGAALPTVQRWPSLDSVTGAGRDALGAASGATRERARSLADRGREAAADRLADALPDIPAAGSLPDLDLARPLQVPGGPSVGDLPGMPDLSATPGVPGVGGLPGLAGVPSTPAMPSLPGAGAMSEITFPSPTFGSGDRGGGTAATAAASPAGAAATVAAGGSGGAPAGGDLDELAHKLYDRIRWRMRAELRLDRERAGLGAGVRH